MTLPTIMTSAGLQPQAPADLRAQLVAAVIATNPGYTANLPGSLIEDVASTDVFAVALCDQARVELVNSLTPYGANAFILNQLGAMLGISQGSQSNTAVYVVFSTSPNQSGLLIPVGFTVTDGANQYVVQDGGLTNSSGVTIPLYAVSSASGSFAVPANTVTTLATSNPYSISITVTNPLPGIAGAASQTEEDYRAQVLQGYRASAQGMPTYLRTILGSVAGVQARLISIRQFPGTTGWQIIVGGGDPYLVAYAIFKAGFNFATLIGSVISSTRNQIVSISDPPDIYTIPFITPPAQYVGVTLTWNTIAVNFVAASAVAQLGGAAIVSYINSVPVGVAINLYELQDVFQDAISGIVASRLLTRMIFIVSVDGTVVPPSFGTGIIAGDPESYFFTTPNAVTVVQG